MASTTIDSVVFGALFSTDTMREIFDDRNLVQKWLDTEAALAKAQGELGVIPKEKADEINAKADVKYIDMIAIGEHYKSSITIVPLLKEFSKVLEGDTGEYLHWGATSQDIVDTGLVLQMRDAYDVIVADMKDCLSVALDLVEKYRDTVMCGRTHVIHALPITFGYKVGVWAEELGRNIQRLEEMKPRVFVGEMAGAVGTLASQPEHGLATQKRVMEILGLEVPVIAWHASRDSQAEFASVLGICAGTLGKSAHEILTLQRTEILELEEPFFMGKVGSSTMPHKRNPQVVEGIIAVCRSVRSVAPVMMESMVSENERDWSCFIAEWEGIPRSCHLLGAALEKMKDVLEHLIVYPQHMEQNLFKLRGLMMSECIMMHLAPRLGRLTSHEIVYECCMHAFEKEEDMKTALLSQDKVKEAFTESEIDSMLDPHNYLGLATQFADRVLEKYGRK